ncbi:hypothetical protein C805_02788 [Eubacterium sp. 14-2]|uniref:Uma2 family endonuclease n=1 Tax=Eubacterium sp. 14-2 TaxID=1235790 RepID=UPI00033C3149|nr:hypothetical protein C805_02788 [Eubacterium sp. 14-2]
MSMPLPKPERYTTQHIYDLPEGQRAELIDGQIYNMAPPTRIHQEISFSLSRSIADFIDSKKGSCRVYPAPFAVFLNQDEHNYMEPDISVICDMDKLDDKGCSGAPDWIIEIASPGTKHMDYGIKLFKYRTAGVREYWIVNPMTGIVNVYDLEHDIKTDQYTFQDEIPSCLFDELIIRPKDLLL